MKKVEAIIQTVQARRSEGRSRQGRHPGDDGFRGEGIRAGRRVTPSSTAARSTWSIFYQGQNRALGSTTRPPRRRGHHRSDGTHGTDWGRQIFICPVDDVIRIRTGERGEQAI